MIDVNEEIQLMDGVNVEISNSVVKVEGSQGKLEKRFAFPNIELKKQDKKIQLVSKNASKREKRMINTFKAHIKNMIKGTLEGFEYKLKICSSHFPMNVTVDKNYVTIKNFLGEKVPRKAQIMPGVKVLVQGDLIQVSGLDKDMVGQTAATIEQTTRVTNRDRRIFQDGCYIVEKPGDEK